MRSIVTKIEGKKEWDFIFKMVENALGLYKYSDNMIKSVLKEIVSNIVSGERGASPNILHSQCI